MQRHSFSRDGLFGGKGGRGGAFGFMNAGAAGGVGGLLRAGRMLADGDLRLIALALIADTPRHGYDIIKALEERSSGVYSPSPGVVYPTLTFLEEAGYVTSAADGSRKVYTITEAGRLHLAEKREVVDDVLGQIERVGRRMAQARDWFDRSRGPREADDDIAREAGAGRADDALAVSRARLRVALASLPADRRDEAATILARAADEIAALR